MENRRDFLVTKLAAGFAAAVKPIMSQTAIHTDSAGLNAGEVKIPVPDGQIPAYRAVPSRAGKYPVVLVVQEIFGVHEHIKDLCRRFAKQGYFAVAPDLYAREGDVSKLQTIPDIAKIVMKVPDSQVMSDLDHSAAFAAKTGKGDGARLGLTGFCWGGRVAWLYAAHNPQLKASVAWYGRLVGSTTALQPKNPIDVAADLKCPVLGLYGGKDQGIPQESIEKMRAAVTQAGKKCEIVVYPDAGHGFNADYRPSYDKAAAEDGWRRLRDWFKRYGAA
jgi:carboxymethylenebutenolidase